jgi:ribonuclease VapC
MIVDTSAMGAVLLKEADADYFRVRLVSAIGRLAMSAAAILELGILADNPLKPVRHEDVDEAIASLNMEIVPVTSVQVAIARAAHAKFGRWSGSPAKLNFGDCFSYALAMERGEPLLFKGNDFGHTDVRGVI